MSGNGGNGTQRNAERAFETLGSFLEQDKWYPQRIEKLLGYRIGFAGEHGRFVCVAEIRGDVEQLLFYVLAPVKVPEEQRLPIAEAITRANYGLRIGNFELDFSDGELRYKSSLDFEGELLTPSFIRNAMYPAVQTMDRYLPAFLAVIYGEKSPAAAIAEVESKS